MMGVLALGVATAFAGYFALHRTRLRVFLVTNCRASGGYRTRCGDPKFIPLNNESK